MYPDSNRLTPRIQYFTKHCHALWKGMGMVCGVKEKMRPDLDVNFLYVPRSIWPGQLLPIILVLFQALPPDRSKAGKDKVLWETHSNTASLVRKAPDPTFPSGKSGACFTVAFFTLYAWVTGSLLLLLMSHRHLKTSSEVPALLRSDIPNPQPCQPEFHSQQKARNMTKQHTSSQ